MKEIRCEDCSNFYTCENMGFYEECLPTFKYFMPYLDGINLRECDSETACLVAECENISEAEVKELLAREDVDKDYGDIYFFAMLPYSTIREALDYNYFTK